MIKEARVKCTLCKARHRFSFMLILNDKNVCNDCCVEYRKIFHGFSNREARKRLINPEFEAFKRGWRKEEVDNNLEPREIPQFVKIYYNNLEEFKRQLAKLEKSDGISKDA